MDMGRESGQSVMIRCLEDLAVRVRRIGLVAELVHGPSYPVLVMRAFSPVMAGAVNFWWYGDGDDVYPIAPVDDPASASRHIHDRTVGTRP